MHPYVARTLLAVITLVGCGWTVYAKAFLDNEPLTTSHNLRLVCAACPQISILIMLLAWGVACDALPDINRWVILFCVVLPFYCLGHCLWGW